MAALQLRAAQQRRHVTRIGRQRAVQRLGGVDVLTVLDERRGGVRVQIAARGRVEAGGGVDRFFQRAQRGTDLAGVPRQRLYDLVAGVLFLRFTPVMKDPGAQRQSEARIERMADEACVSVALFHDRRGLVRVAQHPQHLRQVDPGNVVRASDTNGIVVIAQLQPISTVFPIPEDNVQRVMQRLQQGVPTVVEAWDREQKNKLATGKLITADNQIDTTTGTIKMKAEFPNDNAALFPNQFVNVRMLTQTLEDATLVPTAAIQRGSPGTFVYVVKEDSSVTVAPVKLGPQQGETTVVTSGIRPGAMVVVDGADKLREGAKVELTTREGQAVAPPKQGGRGPRGEGKGGGGKGGGGAKGAQ